MRSYGLAALIGLWASLPGPALAQAGSCQPPAVRKGTQPTEVPLCLVADQVVKTLNAFNSNPNSKALPRLSKVTFDFHTSTAQGEGLSFQILVFSLGANRERDSSNDVSFTYTVPPPPATQPKKTSQTLDLSQTLLATLQAAAAEVKQTESVGPARFSNLSVTLAYGVVWTVSGGGSGTVGLVTLTGSVDRKRADVQTLTLSFGP